MDAEVASVVRGLGIVLVLFSLLMLLVQWMLGTFFMLGMDIPLILIGIAMIVYAQLQLRKIPE